MLMDNFQGTGLWICSLYSANEMDEGNMGNQMLVS